MEENVANYGFFFLVFFCSIFKLLQLHVAGAMPCSIEWLVGPENRYEHFCSEQFSVILTLYSLDKDHHQHNLYLGGGATSFLNDDHFLSCCVLRGVVVSDLCGWCRLFVLSGSTPTAALSWTCLLEKDRIRSQLMVSHFFLRSWMLLMLRSWWHGELPIGIGFGWSIQAINEVLSPPLQTFC